MSNLLSLIDRYKREGHWIEFQNGIDKMKNDVITDMRDGKIKTIEDLSKSNGMLEAYENVKNIDSYIKNWGGEK